MVLFLARCGNGVAQYVLYSHFIREFALESNPCKANVKYNEANFWLKKSAESNFAPAKLELAEGLIFSEDKSTRERGAELLIRLADEGVARAQYVVGLRYGNGQGWVLPKNKYKAIDYVKRAAEQNYSLAVMYLGELYEDIEDYDLAVESYTKALEMYESYEYAMYRLAVLYNAGKGVKSDHQKALQLLLACIKSSNIYKKEVLIEFANMYALGQGVELDYQKAFEYFHSWCICSKDSSEDYYRESSWDWLAEGFDPKRQYEIGLYLCFANKKLDQNKYFKEGMKYLRLALKRGYKQAEIPIKVLLNQGQ